MATRLFAVLTGDIQRSTDLDAETRSALPDRLWDISEALQRDFPETVRRPIDVFRGDSWQMVLDNPAEALRVAVYVRARLRSAFEEVRVDTRVAVGIGPVDFIPEADVSAGDGEAFRRSGKALDAMGRGFRMAVSTTDPVPAPVGRLLDATSKLLDVQISRWTQRQAYAVGGALLGMTQSEIGESWHGTPISQQSVGQHLASAGWNAAEYALTSAETVLSAYRVTS